MTTDEKTPQRRKSDALILVAVLCVFGVVLGGVGLYRHSIGKKSNDWPSVEGKITYSRIESRRRDNRQEHMPSVKYTYTVTGRSLTGSRITASDTYQKSRPGAESVLKGYPAGSEVSVYYNPSDPSVSVLEVGMPSNVYVLILASAGCFLLALIISVSALKRTGA